MNVSNLIMFWATVLSPIIGVIAIIVALVIAHQSSKDTKRQITGIYELMDIVVAAQNPGMLEAKRQYVSQLDLINHQIKEAEIDLNTVHHPFRGRGAPIEDIEADMEDRERLENLSRLKQIKAVLESKLQSIETYLDKVQK
jgi:hypothetical protein